MPIDPNIDPTVDLTNPLEFIDDDDITEHLNLSEGEDLELARRKVLAAGTWVRLYVGSSDVIWYHPPVREAILMLAAHLFENREATLVGVSAEALPFGIYELLAPYREYHF